MNNNINTTEYFNLLKKGIKQTIEGLMSPLDFIVYCKDLEKLFNCRKNSKN
jgi:hypothetical protein